MDRNDFIEKILGGIFAIIAVVAAIVEMFVVGLSNETIVACVKDVFGSLAIVLLFFAIVKDRIPSLDFRAAFNKAMKDITEKYSPLIMKEELSETMHNADTKNAVAKKDKLDRVICYKMAADINVLFDTPCNNYKRFMEIETADTTTVKLLIRKTFFNHPNFSESTLSIVGKNIKSNLAKRFSEYDIKFNDKDNVITIDIGRSVKSNKDAIILSELVDAVIMLYIAESKK